jgi:hypothetical protein
MKGGMLTIPVVGAPSVTELDHCPTLDVLKEAIGGGYIEAVPGFESIRIGARGKRERCVAFCDEEGKLKGMPLNEIATTMWIRARAPTWGQHGLPHFPPDVLCGPVVVVYGDDELLDAL